jgi:hypothetical protein
VFVSIAERRSTQFLVIKFSIHSENWHQQLL